MGLIKRRPKIDVLLPRTLRPGQTFTARVRFDAAASVPVDWIDVQLTGRGRSVVGDGRDALRSDVSLLSLGARLSGAAELRPGKSAYDVRFALPRDLPPSFRGQMASVDYRIGVRASIPWWPDAKADFIVNVDVLPVTAPPPKPVLYSSAVEGPRTTEPYAELSLADAAVEVGGTLAGAVALGNVAYARYAGLEVALVVIERARAAGVERTGELARYLVRLPVATPTESEPIPFRIRLPSDAPPSLVHALFDLSWCVELRAKRRLARDLTLVVPIVVLPRGETQADARPARAPPVVGSERTHELWREVAEKNGLELQDDELVGQVGEVSLHIFREHLGSRGIYFTAELSFPSLHLGLDGGKKSGFRRLFTGHDTLLGHAAWDRAHYLTGTHAEQVRAFARAMENVLAEQRVRDLTDDRVVLEVSSVGLGARPLAELARAAVAVAQAIPAARAAIPPPPGFELGPWRELAHRLGAQLEPARMVVSGELDGQAARVETEWGGDAPLSTRVELLPRQPLAERWLGVFVSDGAGFSTPVGDAAGRPASFPAEARAELAFLAAHAHALELEASRLAVVLSAPLARAEHVAEVLAELGRLAELCAAKRSAYR